MSDDDMKSGAGDPGETMNMGSGESAGSSTGPQQESWHTVEMPKAPRPASSTPDSTPPTPPQPSEAERTVLEGAGSAPKSPTPMPAPLPAPQYASGGSSSFGSGSQPEMIGTPPMQD